MITQPTKSKSFFELFKERVIVRVGHYFCCIHIFSAKLLISFQTFFNLKYIQKLEIHEFDVRLIFTPMCGGRICHVLLTVQKIKRPSGSRAVEVMEGFEEHKRVPAVIGAIDGPHIPIKAPRECPENYINRKDFHSIVLQACCNHKMLFTNCYCGWPGSVHDSRVSRNSDIFDSASNRHDDFKHGSWPHTRI